MHRNPVESKCTSGELRPSSPAVLSRASVDARGEVRNASGEMERSRPSGMDLDLQAQRFERGRTRGGRNYTLALVQPTV